MTKFFLDSEFYENGKTIEMISLALVAEGDNGRSESEGGRYLYIENTDFDWTRVPDDHWIQTNVRPHLGTYGTPHSKKVPFQREENTTWGDVIKDFMKWFSPPYEFWGYYADYDWVLFCQQFGRMVDLPKGWPMFCMDLKQWAVMLGNPILPAQDTVEHHALADARWNKTVWHYLNRIEMRLH